MSDLLKRHSRTILLQDIDFEGYLSISQSKVLIIGAGGLSSSIISILSSSGVKEIGIWEDDILEISNLQRQFIFKEQDVGKEKSILARNFIKNLNSSITISLVNKKLSEETFTEFTEFANNFTVIIDGTDSFTSRVLSNKASILLKKPLFTGSAVGFEGHIYSFAGFTYQNPCYSCLFGSDYKTFIEQKTCANSGVFPPIPSIVGSIISQNVLYFLATSNCDFTKFISINFNRANYFKEIRMKKDEKCTICLKY